MLCLPLIFKLIRLRDPVKKLIGACYLFNYFHWPFCVLIIVLTAKCSYVLFDKFYYNYYSSGIVYFLNFYCLNSWCFVLFYFLLFPHTNVQVSICKLIMKIIITTVIMFADLHSSRSYKK